MGARIILIPEEVQPVAGTALRPAADLSDPAERKRISPTAIQTFRQITDQKWTLTEAQSLGLLGGIASSTYQSWRIAPGGRELGQDTLTRISLVIGIFKALHGYFNDSLADGWLKYANRAPMFTGRTPIDFMIQEGIPGMLQVRRMLDGWRAGN
jgi:uncharacterized protein (DUF2384 family)